MNNDVVKEVEESVENENSTVEKPKTENSVEPSSEETSLSESSLTSETVEESQNSAEMDFGAILEKFEQDQTIYHVGELVTGKVVGVSDRGVLIDFGYKSEGVAPSEDFATPEGESSVKEGDEVEVVIRSIHTGDAPPVLSRSDALRRQAWDTIEKAYKDGMPITGRVIDKTKGGLRVGIGGVEAFLPGSQVDSRPIRNLDTYKGQDLEVKVIKFSRRRNNIVLSRKVLTDEIINQQKAETLNSIEEGYVVEGVIKNLTEYGAFVDLGGIDGLLHVTDMSWGRIQHPGEQFKVGDNVQVKVLKLDKAKEKVSLGYKQLIPDPWSTVVEVYPVDAKIKGRVSSVTEYGAFIELEPGVEGLVHISEMSWSKRIKSPKSILKKGDEVEVQVLGIDTEERRISLGMKQLQPNPWDTVADRYSIGSKVRGKVRNLTDFGAFIEIEDGVDGLVHVSDISWSKKIKHPKEVLKRDQEVDAIVTNIDSEGQRLSLSIKELTPSAWESFVATHKVGDIVKGKVSRFAGFGVFVELGDDLEGLCHISELSDERVESPESVVSIGQELEFKILRIEHEDQKIGLSARAVGKEDEPIVDVKSYSTTAKSGMASLGELANLKFGRQTAEEPKEDKKAVKSEAVKAAEKESSDVSAAEEPEVDSETTSETVVEEETSEAQTEEVTSETASETAAEEETPETVEESSEEKEATGTSSEAATETVSEVEATDGGEDASAETITEETEAAKAE